MKAWMTHNPKCGTSRNVLAFLRERGIELEVVEYLKAPLTNTEIAALVKAMDVPVTDVVRWKEKDVVAEAGIDGDSSDKALLAAMATFPILLNRPIVTTPKGTKLCRPSESVQALL